MNMVRCCVQFNDFVTANRWVLGNWGSKRYNGYVEKKFPFNKACEPSNYRNDKSARWRVKITNEKTQN